MAFGLIKSRFQCLKHLRVTPPRACDIVVACVVLHNIACLRKEKQPRIVAALKQYLKKMKQAELYETHMPIIILLNMVQTAFKFSLALNFPLNLTDTQKSKSLICHFPLFSVKLPVRGENIQINVVENDQKGHVFVF